MEAVCKSYFIKSAILSVITIAKNNKTLQTSLFHVHILCTVNTMNTMKTICTIQKDSCDSSCSDSRIFKEEYMRSKDLLLQFEGVITYNMPTQQWEKEFIVLDKNQDGFISFNELCSYCTSNMINCKDFVHTCQNTDAADDLSVCVHCVGKRECM